MLSGLFQLLVNPVNIYEEEKMVILYSMVGECWAKASWRLTYRPLEGGRSKERKPLLA